MKGHLKSKLVLFFILVGVINYLAEAKEIRPDHAMIGIKGALFVNRTPERVVINRHTKEFLEHPETYVNPSRANTQTGVRIIFSTNSDVVKVHFREREDADIRQKRFGIYCNGKFTREITGMDLVLNNPATGYCLWEIVLPAFCGVDFLGLEIQDEASLRTLPKENRKIYVAIGNSITHGTGQKGAAFHTYPFILAEKNGWELYNLAVGGSKISWPVAHLTKGIEADVITVLWGYNDWNSNLLLEEDIQPAFERLLRELRNIQPDAHIYCILPTVSKRKAPRSGDYTLDAMRDMQKKVVESIQNKGDKKVCLIHGDKLTTEDDLNDDVHLSAKGAARFADKLNGLIQSD